MADTTYKPYQVTSYDDWKSKISDTVNNDSDYQAAKAKLEETTNNKPVYAGTYDNDVANAYNNIVNREKFQYNLDDDALYKQYADKYMAAGKLAMKNSMGQSAALTGGYGSSYGAAVGQQTYDSYLQGLNDKAIEFYDRAYGRYQDEGNRLKDIYGLAQDMANTEYGRYSDLLGQYNTDRSFDYGAMQDAYNNVYNRDVQAYSRYTNDESIMSDYAYNLASQGDFTLLAQMFGQEAYDELYGDLEEIGVWGTWEPCHKEMLGHGIVGVENLGGDLDKIIPGRWFRFNCFPLRWYLGDGTARQGQLLYIR